MNQPQEEEQKHSMVDYGDDEAFFESKIDRSKIQKAQAKQAEKEKHAAANAKPALEDDFFDA